jgi:hypothetical protein
MGDREFDRTASLVNLLEKASPIMSSASRCRHAGYSLSHLRRLPKKTATPPRGHDPSSMTDARPGVLSFSSTFVTAQDHRGIEFEPEV